MTRGEQPFIEITKRLIRRKIFCRLSNFSSTQLDKKNRNITAKILGGQRFKKAGSIFIYVSKESEVKTIPIIKRALSLKKNIFVPWIDPKKKKIHAVQIRSLANDLEKGKFGIPEPKSRKNELWNLEQIDLAILPGVAFDRQGNRLGRGGGYFDRFLKSLKRTHKIGLAFREQIVKEIPVLKHDVKMDEVISDDRR